MDNGSSPLFVASQDGQTDIVSLLLNANANPNSQRDDGTSPLYIAGQQGHTDIVSLLLKANANPNSQKDDGSSPLSLLLGKVTLA